VEYSPEIFDVDKPDFVLPEFVNRITPVSGAVDSGVINPDRWRSFAVYHDGEDEPDRPSGDGQDGGWHHLQTFRSIWQSTKMSESVESGEWGLPVRIRAERGTDDVTPIWLSLEPQNVTLDTDGDGNLPAGLFPLTVKARLFKWNSLLTGAVFSIQSASDGISVDSNGVITVNENTVLNDENAVTVRAEYQGTVYTATLFITKNINNYASRYLGTVKKLSTAEATVTIEKGPVMGQVRARQGDYVLAVVAAGGRLAGSVFQWSGVAWEYRTPENYSELYIRCFKDGLDVPELSQDMGWFGAVFAKLLVAQQAFITELSAQVIELREFGEIRSTSFGKIPEGFRIEANGKAEFNEAIIRGGHFSLQYDRVFRSNGTNNTVGHIYNFLNNFRSRFNPSYPIIICSGYIKKLLDKTINDDNNIHSLLYIYIRTNGGFDIVCMTSPDRMGTTFSFQPNTINIKAGDSSSFEDAQFYIL
jgi:hypothetical protein